MLPSPAQLSWYRGHVQHRRTALVVDECPLTERSVAGALGPAWRVFAVVSSDEALRFLDGVLVDVIIADGALLTAAGPPFRDRLARTPRVSTIPLLVLPPGAEELRAAVAALLP
jgi:hypothetical protein